jgi:hypothetical protein
LPVVVVRREGVQRGHLPPCGNPACQHRGETSARIAHLADWRQRRGQRERGARS